MKFQVRADFVIHDTRLVKIGDRQTEQTNSYFEDDQVDFDEETALRHLHKLEPQDKAAEKFLSARFAPVAGLDDAGVVDDETCAD